MVKTSDPAPETLPLRAYLLGSASEREVDAIESAYFAGEAAVDHIAEAEDDLIADYLEGRLDADEQARFQRHYLATPRHRERLALVRALREKAGASGSASGLRVPRGPRLVVVLALAATLIVWLAIGHAVRDGGSEAPAEQVARLTVPSVGVRSGGSTPTIEVDAKTRRVELRLERGETNLAAPLVATIRTVDGDVVWRGEAALPAAADAASIAAIVSFPPETLPGGDYVLSLENERYAFRVRRR